MNHERPSAHLNIILPVFNEEKRLEQGVLATVAYFDSIDYDDYVLTIVDNASVDATQSIAESLCQRFCQVRYVRIEEKGVGAAFRRGVEANESPIVGYMDIDLSTDVKHLQDMLVVFDSDEQVGMVNASRWASDSDTNGRKWYRNLTSNGLTLMLKAALKMRSTDAICGFKFFRSEFVEQLILQSDTTENGWFYIIELLLRAERTEKKVYELPVHWEDDSENSKVEMIPLICNYCQQIARLKHSFKKERDQARAKAGGIHG